MRTHTNGYSETKIPSYGRSRLTFDNADKLNATFQDDGFTAE